MKKFLSLILTVVLINAMPASAVIQNLPAPDVQQVKSNLIVKNKIDEPVICSKTTDNEFCKTFDLVKTPIKLESYLNEDYIASEYTLKSTKTFEIKKIENALPPESVKYNYQKNRFRLSDAIILIPTTAIGLPIIMTALPFLPVALAGNLNDSVCKNNCTPTQLMVNDFVVVPAAVTGIVIIETAAAPFVITGLAGKSAWHIIAAPYYWVKDRKNDKIATTEVKRLNNLNNIFVHSENQPTKFVALTKNNVPGVKIHIKETSTGKIYIFEK